MPQSQSYRYGRRSQTRRPYNSNRPQNNKRQPKKAYIHPSRFIQSANPHTEEAYVPMHSFADFAVDAILKRNLEAMGFKDPSPIQDEAIPYGLAGKDIVGIANTGTGKTAAFAIPMLNRLIADPTSKAIILAPTRELAEQIEQQCRLIGKGSKLRGALLIGGTSMGPQLRDLQQDPRIIIGTPGRVKDHLERGTLYLDDCNIVVLDEVDRMLDMGFVQDITHILNSTSSGRQSFYFSATLDSRVQGIIESFSEDPVQISVKSGETSDNVDQNIVKYSAYDKIDKLHDILISESTTKTIIFDDTQRTVERLSKDLIDRGFQAESIHGGKSQGQRQRVLRQFKNSEINVLVATDVAARGLDVSDISHVINYSLPQSYDDYVHRIGRTGRAGKVGHALTFVEHSQY
jgi:superfamily II DNA/RNA helicase